MILRRFPQPTWESLSAMGEIAREIADITISQDNLMGIVTLKRTQSEIDEADSSELSNDRGNQYRPDPVWALPEPFSRRRRRCFTIRLR